GPAGLAAARAVEAAGGDALVLDEHPALGGPIYRAHAPPWRAPARALHGTRVVVAQPARGLGGRAPSLADHRDRGARAVPAVPGLDLARRVRRGRAAAARQVGLAGR